MISLVGHTKKESEISFMGRREYVMILIIVYHHFFLVPGEYIASGSDDGRWFIWEKKTGRLLKMLHGDNAGKNHLTSKNWR